MLCVCVCVWFLASQYFQKFLLEYAYRRTFKNPILEGKKINNVSISTIHTGPERSNFQDIIGMLRCIFSAPPP